MSKKENVISVAVILLAVAIVLSIGSTLVSKTMRVYSGIAEYSVDNFSDNKKSFVCVSDIVSRVFEEEHEKNSDVGRVYMVGYGEDEWVFNCVLDGDSTQNYSVTKNVSGAEAEALEAVCDAMSFENNQYFSVEALDDRVVFRIGAPYAVIYMKNGGRPKYVNSSDEEHEKFVADRLSLKWYEVIYD